MLVDPLPQYTASTSEKYYRMKLLPNYNSDSLLVTSAKSE